MGKIEIKEYSNIRNIVMNRFLKEGLIQQDEVKDIWMKEIKNGIFVVGKKNVWLYVNNKGETIFSTFGIYKDLGKEKYNAYLKKLGYKEIKDKTGYYHMINIKTGKELNQTSYEYYKLFETLGNMQLRDFGKKIYDFKGDFVKRLTDDTNIVYMALPKEERQEYINQLKQDMIVQAETMVKFYTLKPLELIFLEKHNMISKEEYKKLKNKVYTFEYIKKLIENPVWNYVEGETKEYKINGKLYKIETNGITEDELKLYLDLKIINKEEYELLKDILEKERLKKEKKEHIEETKENISSLEDSITSNLA